MAARRAEDDAGPWPPRPPEARRPAPERHARWTDPEKPRDEPRESPPNLIWWILGAILILAVLSVMIRMFLVL